MRLTGIAWCLAGVLVVFVVARCESFAQEKTPESEKEQKRIKELIDALIPAPLETAEQLDERLGAIEELRKIGEPAVPQLIDAAIGGELTQSYWASQILVTIGKPALPAVRERWGKLTDTQRWKLMPLREKYDLDGVREFARSCLEDAGCVGFEAWQFVLRTKDTKIKERYYKILRGEENLKAAHRKWDILPGKETIFDKDEEDKILISLLKSDSWVATGKDHRQYTEDFLPRWWPDGRDELIELIKNRKLVSAAPALLKVLQEQGEKEGYLAEAIVPLLVEFRYKESIPALEILARKPAKPDERPRFSDLDRGMIQSLAAKALEELRLAKP
jgi:hypothetical protein